MKMEEYDEIMSYEEQLAQAREESLFLLQEQEKQQYEEELRRVLQLSEMELKQKQEEDSRRARELSQQRARHLQQLQYGIPLPPALKRGQTDDELEAAIQQSLLQYSQPRRNVIGFTDETEALERALRASAEEAEADLLLRIEQKRQLELQRQARIRSNPAPVSALMTSDEEAAQINAAIALSLAEAEQWQPVEDITQPRRLQAVINCPVEYGTILKSAPARNYLQRKHGVIIVAKETSIEIKHENDPDILDIAQRELMELFSEPASLFQEILRLHRNEQIHVYVDQSNIFHSAQMEYDRKTGKSVRNQSLRLQVNNLARIVANDRDCVKRVVVGSESVSNKSTESFWKYWRNAGFEAHVFDRNPGKKEAIVDDATIGMIYKGLHEHKNNTLVILTGDGNDNNGRANFFECILHALNSNWKVELWSWEVSLSQKYYELCAGYYHTGRFSIHFLDLWRDKIVFSNKKKFRSTLYASIKANAASEEEEEEDEDEDEFCCPITLELLTDPVAVPTCPYHFERAQLEMYLRNSQQCPVTRKALSIQDIMQPNPEFLLKLQRFKRNNA